MGRTLRATATPKGLAPSVRRPPGTRQRNLQGSSARMIGPRPRQSETRWRSGLSYKECVSYSCSFSEDVGQLTQSLEFNARAEIDFARNVIEQCPIRADRPFHCPRRIRIAVLY